MKNMLKYATIFLTVIFLGNVFAATQLHPTTDSITINSVEPFTGSTSGGTFVTIHGSGFIGASQVIFGDVAVEATVHDDSTIICVTPPHAQGPVNVYVVGNGVGELQNGFTYY